MLLSLDQNKKLGNPENYKWDCDEESHQAKLTIVKKYKD